MDTARADTDLLYKLDARGDDFSIPRDVDFLLKAPSREKAELVRDFVNEFQYGVAKTIDTAGEFSVLVVINTPIVQNVILSLSAFMECLAQLYGLDYDGWGCVAQRGHRRARPRARKKATPRKSAKPRGR